MADLSLADALTEPSPDIEGEIKRDFIATLEAEAFDDVVGETVGKQTIFLSWMLMRKPGTQSQRRNHAQKLARLKILHLLNQHC